MLVNKSTEKFSHKVEKSCLFDRARNWEALRRVLTTISRDRI